MRGNRRGAHCRPWRLVGLWSAVALVAGCGSAAPTLVDGRAISMRFDPNRVAGLPATDGPSGPKAAEESTAGRVRNTDDGQADRMALAAVEDIENYWQTNYQAPLPGVFSPVSELVSVDPDAADPQVCGADPSEMAFNALYCHRGNLIVWDRVKLLPAASKYFGDLSINGLLAHEYGHAIQREAGLIDESTPVLVAEQQADCFAGGYLRWVAEGKSPRFSMNTTLALDRVLAGAIAIRDRPPSFNPFGLLPVEASHGTALDRVSAVQQGFDVGPFSCARITVADIQQRRAGIPAVLFDPATPLSDMPIHEQTLSSLIGVLNSLFTPARPPTLRLGVTCGPGPAVYCPDTNAVEVDLAALQELATPADENEKVLLQGDNSAISVVTSRYLLAVQDQRGLSVDGHTTALRTACLTGVAQSRMADPATSNNQLVLGPGDLDKAVSGLLTNGIVATDVHGNGVPSGFTGDATTCYHRFP